MFLRGFRKEQVTGMLQIRPLVEMAFETAAQKAQVFLADIRLISLFDEEVLLVYDAVVRQDLYRFCPGGVHGLVLGTCQREQFRQFHPVCHGDVRILADDAAVLHGQ